MALKKAYMDDFEIVKIFCIFAKKKVFMYHYTPNTEGFKHYKYKKYKIDFFKQTAIINWKCKVDEDYDESYSYKHLHKVVADKLREQDIFNKKFILLQETSPAAYTQLPVDTELLELYLNFKRDDLMTKEKKAEVRRFLDNL